MVGGQRCTVVYQARSHVVGIGTEGLVERGGLPRMKQARRSEQQCMAGASVCVFVKEAGFELLFITAG
jgi:hypothetical protein